MQQKKELASFSSIMCSVVKKSLSGKANIKTNAKRDIKVVANIASFTEFFILTNNFAPLP